MNINVVIRKGCTDLHKCIFDDDSEECEVCWGNECNNQRMNKNK
jgi:hypothetical protein